MKKTLTIIAICSCTALVFGLGASVNLAVGKLATSALHPSSTEVLWILDTYLIVFGCLLIPAGALGDRLGRKKVMLAGLAILAIGSVASALVPTVPLVIAARALTGLGAALILPSSLPLLMAVYTPDKRDHAVATWTSMTAVGGVLGNVAGGAVLQYFDWQVLFAVAAPLAVIGAGLLDYAAPSMPGHNHKIDVGGTVLLVVAVFGLLFGVIEGRELGWGEPVVVGALIAAVVFFAAFVWYELRQQAPLLDPRVFVYRGARAGAIGVTCAFIAMYAMFYLNGQYLMSIKGYAPVVAGLAVVPLALVMAGLARFAPKLGKKYGNRIIVVGGLLLIAIGLVLLGTRGADSSYGVYLICLLAIGIGAALSNPALSSAIVSSLPAEKSGTGAGLNSFAREMGGALGLAVFGTLVGASFTSELSKAGITTSGRDVGAVLASTPSTDTTALDTIRTAFTHATSTSMWIVAGAMAIGAIGIAAWIPGKPKPVPAPVDAETETVAAS